MTDSGCVCLDWYNEQADNQPTALILPGMTGIIFVFLHGSYMVCIPLYWESLNSHNFCLECPISDILCFSGSLK